MARVNLRAAFMAGVDSSITAQQVFTNRVNEITAFSTALRHFEDELAGAALSPVLDRTQGRRNVLSFYGVGGIGKTTLSHELERRFTDEAEADKRTDAVSVRIDLADEGASDMENLLLRLRACLGQLGSRWLAFDLALSCYWVRAHPGEPLQEFIDTAPLIRRFAKAVRLDNQIAANLESVVPTDVRGLPGLAQRAGLGVYRAVRDRIRDGRLLADCHLLRELIDAEANNETLSYFPYLLAWDLEQLPRRRDRRPSVCVFVDTFEAVNDRMHRDSESLVRRCIFLMPNVLFTLTGRNRIDWADGDPVTDPDFMGQERWPNLHFSNHTREPRQHLVGYLSDTDADAHLRGALVKQAEPVIADEIRQRILSGAQGLPLYLDLSVSHYVELLGSGREAQPEDFGGSFGAVATRSLRDLSPRERDLARTASLVDRFDADLLRAGQPDTSHGQIAHFLTRPFLTRDETYEPPFALHVTLRSAIRDADRRMPDGWSDRDRSEVAFRLLRRIGERLDEGADRSTLARTLETGVKLAFGQNVFHDWLVDATQRLVEAGQWSTLGELRLRYQDQPTVPKLRTLGAAIDGVLLRRTGDPRQAVALLQEARSAIEADSKVGRLLQLHLAHALRNVGDYSGAARIYRDLLAGDFRDVARYWLCDHDFLNGRFKTALADLGSWRGRNAAEEGERLRLVGHIERVNGLVDQAVETYNEAVDLARSQDLAAAQAKALTNVAQTTCWSGDMSAIEEIGSQVRELLDMVPNRVELVKLRCAEAIAATMADDPETAATAIYDTRQMAEDIGYRGGHNLADVASILLDSHLGQGDRACQTLQDLDHRTRTSGGNTYWVPIAACWIDGIEAAKPRARGIEWLDGLDETLDRWVQVARR